jgi:tetratricopeptide (TPR) repeat protein
MKTLFVSSALLWSAVSSSAWAVRPQEGLACLAVGDLACAIEVRDSLVLANEQSEVTKVLELRTLFREGRYPEAVEVLDQLSESEWLTRDKNPYRPTEVASRGLEEAALDGSRVRYAAGLESILRDDALDVLERSRTVYGELFGGELNHDVLLDIFPTAQRFIMASGLPPEAVRKTGVIALSKWSRLLITSPRALATGYRWKTAVSHEYIHLVVAWRSEERAPVWLQEGLAKLLEERWRTGKNNPLTLHQESLLRKALQEDSFVPFEKFRHSMAYLDSGDEAALAYAQVSTLLEHVLERSGDVVLPIIMDRIRNGEVPELVVAEAGAYLDFQALMLGWTQWLRERELSTQDVASLPVVLDADADEYATDPLLAYGNLQARAARLGDLLLERDRPLAALIEYRKVSDGEGPQSPLLFEREARCLAALDRHDEALALTAEGVRLYPDFTPLQIARGQLLDAIDRPKAAVEAWLSAHALNPFNPVTQRALVEDFTRLGRSQEAARHAEILRIIETGGISSLFEE